MLLATLTLLSLGLLPQDTRKPPKPADGEGVVATKDQLQVVGLANAGFLLRSGNFSVLIDAFARDSIQGYESLPENALRKLQNGEKPFDGYALALVSHLHPDHFHARTCERFLKNNPMAALMSGPQVAGRLAEAAKSFADVRQQVRSISVEYGTPKAIDRGLQNMGVEFYLLPHAGAEEVGGGEVVENYGHLVNMGGFKVLHVGDADADPAAFELYDLAAKNIDIAILPYWFFTSPEGVRIVDELIAPDVTILCHFQEAEKALFVERLVLDSPEVVVFQSMFESRIFDRRRPPDAAEKGEPESSDD